MTVMRPRPRTAYNAAENTSTAIPRITPSRNERSAEEGINQNERELRHQQNGVMMQPDFLGSSSGLGRRGEVLQPHGCSSRRILGRTAGERKVILNALSISKENGAGEPVG